MKTWASTRRQCATWCATNSCLYWPNSKLTVNQVQYVVSSMQMVTFDRPQSRILPMTNVGVRLELSKINFVMTADFNATTDLWCVTHRL